MLLPAVTSIKIHISINVTCDFLDQLVRSWSILENMDKSSYYPAKNVVEKMPQGYALPIDRVVWINIFLKIFSAEAAAEPTHNSLKLYKSKVSEYT